MISGAKHVGKVYVEDENNFLTYIEQPSSPYLTSYYVEDEDNVGSVKKRGEGHSSTTRYKGNGAYVYGRGDEITRYIITGTYNNAKSSDGADIGTVYKVSEVTCYRGNGTQGYLRGSSVQAIDYDGTLYESDGTHTYSLYTKVSKTLYAAGTRKTQTLYKEYTNALYDKGVDVAYTPASFITRNTTVLKA